MYLFGDIKTKEEYVVIYITGDAHGSTEKFLDVEDKVNPLKGDFVLVAGDFGFIFTNTKVDDMLLDILSFKPYTILFVDGNHECFPSIYSYPEEEWNGGKIHRIRDNIFHLERGQVFTIDGKKIFTFGGALSTDRFFRKLGFSYWDEEIPSKDEIEEGRINLQKNSNCVDYIVTHTLPTSVKELMGFPVKDTDEDKPFTDFLDKIRVGISYKKWFAGHFHMDKYATESDNIRILYNGVAIMD